jgi:hypothetical protein
LELIFLSYNYVDHSAVQSRWCHFHYICIEKLYLGKTHVHNRVILSKCHIYDPPNQFGMHTSLEQCKYHDDRLIFGQFYDHEIHKPELNIGMFHLTNRTSK